MLPIELITHIMRVEVVPSKTFVVALISKYQWTTEVAEMSLEIGIGKKRTELDSSPIHCLSQQLPIFTRSIACYMANPATVK